MNRMRKNKLFPRQVSDIGAFLFVVIMMPATYIYETAIVVPAIYSSGIFSRVRFNFQGCKFLVKIWIDYRQDLCLNRQFHILAPYAYYVHNAVGLFFLVNLIGNFLGLWLTDTSTRFIVLPSVIKVRNRILRWKWNIMLCIQKKYHEQLYILSNHIPFRTRNGIFVLLVSLSPHHEPGIVTFVEYVF